MFRSESSNSNIELEAPTRRHIGEEIIVDYLEDFGILTGCLLLLGFTGGRTKQLVSHRLSTHGLKRSLIFLCFLPFGLSAALRQSYY